MKNEAGSYAYRLYNRYGVRRLDWRFWTVALYLCRHLALLLLLGVSHGRGGGGPPIAGWSGAIEPIYLAADAPALLLLVVAGARVPQSGRLARFVWRHGRWLIVLAAAGFLGLLVTRHGLSIGRYSAVDAIEIAVNALVVGYAIGSGYFRELFAQFPPPVSPPAA